MVITDSISESVRLVWIIFRTSSEVQFNSFSLGLS